MDESLLDRARARITGDARQCLGMLAAAAPAVRTLERLADYLSGRGWKATPCVDVRPLAGVQLSINVALLTGPAHRLAELLGDVEALDIGIFRGHDSQAERWDCREYTLHLAGGLRIKLLVLVRASRLLAAA